ncbi:MAG: addiction module protein [Chitinophagaceae bacterium]
MPATTPHIFLPLDFNQLFDLVRQLPNSQKRQLADLLLQEEAADDIPETHKKLVLARIKKYDRNPELLIDEEDAIKMINQM